MFKYFKYISLSFIFLIAILYISALYFNQSIKYGFDKSIPYQLDREGPFIAFESDSTAKIQYIRGNPKEGFETTTEIVNTDTSIKLPVYYPPENSEFEVAVDFKIENERVVYPSVEKLFAVSDQEGNFRVLKNLLIANKVVGDDLKWTFGKGHLVLLGDFVDKGYFVTQTLWFIYKLEREAKKAGGKVHYILGNHEINNLQGYYNSTAQKYWYIVNVLGLKRNEFYGFNSFLGRWLASKNVVEKIGSTIFVHGGLHPDFAKHDLTIEQINNQIKSRYFTPYFPKKDSKATYELLFSTKKSPSWYRGYFNKNLAQNEIDDLIEKFGVQQIVAGHTTVSKVCKFYDERIIGIDVKSPLDHLKYFPERRTEALLFENEKWYRVNDNGMKKLIKQSRKQ